MTETGRMPAGVIIVGLNGCGKTTLGKALADALDGFAMDVEDYYFPPGSAVPFTLSRTKDEVRALMLADMQAHPRFVLSSVNGEWGEAIEGALRCVVFLSAPTEVRLTRIEQREQSRFGHRVLPGGDMYEQQRRFHSYAASRSEGPIEAWLSRVALPTLRLDALDPIERNVARAAAFYKALTPGER